MTIHPLCIRIKNVKILTIPSVRALFTRTAVCLYISFSSYTLSAALPTVPTPTPGQWCSDSTAAKAYAEANGIPVIAIWGSTACGYCNAYDTALSDSAFITWRQSTPYIYIYIKNTQDSFYNWMWGVTPGAPQTLDSYPFLMYYWKKEGQVLVEQRHIGRTAGNYAIGSPLAGRTRALAEQYFAAYSSNPVLTDAWDTNDDTRAGTTNILIMAGTSAQGPHRLSSTDTNDWFKITGFRAADTNVFSFSDVSTNAFVSKLAAYFYVGTSTAPAGVLTNLQGTFKYVASDTNQPLFIFVNRATNTSATVTYKLNYSAPDNDSSVVGVAVSYIGVKSAIMISPEHSGPSGVSLRLGGPDLLDDGQMAGIEWSTKGPGILSFDWKVSSEEDFDWLSFYEVSSSGPIQISGITSWARHSVTVLGAPETTHTFRWEYEKDESVYDGDDCGWIDAITWTPLYSVSVENGTGDGLYTNRSSVVIKADAAEGKRFYRWIGDAASLGDIHAATTTVTVSDSALTVTATYSVLMTVAQGTGSGWYPVGGFFNVIADPDPLYKEFAEWTGSGAGYAVDRFIRGTSVIVPAFPALLSATYRDSVARTAGCWGRNFTSEGTSGGVSVDPSAGSPSATAAVKLGGTGIIPNNGFAAFETVVTNSGTVSFWWKVSSQANADYLQFRIDGIVTNAISGTDGGWTQVVRRVEGAGAHTVRWEYRRDASIASGTDAGWVDDIIWSPDTPDPRLVPIIIHAALTNQAMSIQFMGERGLAYRVQTNATLNPTGWADYQSIQPVWINESNGVHRFEISPPSSGPATLFYKITTSPSAP